MEAYQNRVVAEKEVLDGKISKLEAFIQSDQAGGIDGDDLHLLTSQLRIMLEYSKVLRLRIERFQ